MFYSRRRAEARALAGGPPVAATAPIKPLPPSAIAALQKGLKGKLVLPGQPDYEQDRALFNPKFNKFPVGIVYAAAESDVHLALNVAQANGIAVAVRAGGHSTGGWSANEGVLIDVSGLNYVQIDPKARTAWIGAGANFGDINTALEKAGLHVPGGTCPDVCVGGYMQGGGYGFTARMFGMNCDNVRAVRVMLANGAVLRADDKVNRDLWWAVRGGTGGNFGVLLSVQYQLVPLDQIFAFSVGFPFGTAQGMRDSAEALIAIQRDLIHDPKLDSLGFQLAFAYQGPQLQTAVPTVELKAMNLGTEAQGRAMMQRIGKLPGAQVQWGTMGKYAALNDKLMTEPYEIPMFPINAIPCENKQARYVQTPIPFTAWEGLLAHFRTMPTPYSCIYGCEMYGAAIARYPLDDSAFVHRQADFDLFCDVFWYDNDDEPPMQAFIQEWVRKMAPYWNGEVYQNYPNIELADYRHAYWASAFPKLLQVKQKYNPTDLMTFPQAIEPYRGRPPGPPVDTSVAAAIVPEKAPPKAIPA